MRRFSAYIDYLGLSQHCLYIQASPSLYQSGPSIWLCVFLQLLDHAI